MTSAERELSHSTIGTQWTPRDVISEPLVPQGRDVIEQGMTSFRYDAVDGSSTMNTFLKIDR